MAGFPCTQASTHARTHAGKQASIQPLIPVQTYVRSSTTPFRSKPKIERMKYVSRPIMHIFCSILFDCSTSSIWYTILITALMR